MSPKSVICCLAATAFVATTASQASVSSANPNPGGKWRSTNFNACARR
jgi:hypothetical protein